MPQHPASVSHTPVCSLVHSVLILQHKIHVLQVTNAAEAWQQGYESVHFLARYSIFYRADLDEAWTKGRCRSIWYTLAANFTFWVGACTELFKHLLCVTTHPQFLVLELRVSMGACLGQYSQMIHHHGVSLSKQHIA